MELRVDRSYLDSCVDGFEQMAVDEALLELRSRGVIGDWLRIYRFCPSAVSIGYFQRVRSVVNVDEVERLGIHLVRRFTGGGAVYHDSEGEVVYAIALEVRGELSDVAKSFELICSGIVEALRELGVEAQFKPLNDVAVLGRKISGSAQARRFRRVWALLQHGTLLISTDLDIMERVLKPLSDKLARYGAKRIRDAVIRIVDVLGREIPRHRVADAIEAGFERVLKATVVRDSLPREVLELARDLVPKYRDRRWILSRE